MLTAAQTQQLLTLYPVLAELAPPRREAALAQARVLRVAAGTPLFQEAQACAAFPFVLSGTVRVYKTSASGRELPLYRVGPGDACVVSAGCVLGARPYNAAGRAQTDCELVLLPDHDFEALLGETAVRRAVFALFSERLAELMQLIEEVAFRKLDQRLAGALLGKGTVLHCSHQDLANELGSVREMVSRLLKGFAEDGLVRLGREEITLLDPAGLRRIATTH